MRGLVAELAERGVKVDHVQVWRFVHAEGLRFQKKRAARRTTPAVDRADWIDAPCVSDQPVNGQSFTYYVEQCLVPTLSPGDVVIMDNLSSHKQPAVHAAIRSVGARLRRSPA